MDKEEKNFDAWSDIKKGIESSTDAPPLFHEREIWWCSLGVNIGVETDGKPDRYERPVLIVRRFNLDFAWVLPITSNTKESPFRYLFTLNGIESSIMLTQLKTISAKRLSRKMCTMKTGMFLEVKIRVSMQLLKSETPSFDGESRRPKP